MVLADFSLKSASRDPPEAQKSIDHFGFDHDEKALAPLLRRFFPFLRRRLLPEKKAIGFSRFYREKTHFWGTNPEHGGSFAILIL